MTERREILEFADKTVDRAIEAACRHFKVDKDQLNIKLITRGSTGLFGLGGRKAKITACLKEGVVPGSGSGQEQEDERHSSSAESPSTAGHDHDMKDDAAPASAPDDTAYSPVESGHDADADRHSLSPGLLAEEGVEIDASAYSPGGDDEETEERQEEAEPSSATDQHDSGRKESSEVQEPEEEQEPAELSDEMLERLERARVFTTQILDKAGLDAIVEINADASNPCLEISGEDISLVIGKDGHTLDAIEYIVNLTLKRSDEKGGRRIPVDAQGYRAKREDGLRRTAEKLALKARKTRRSVAMAPMNSRERRIVHMAVKGINGVRTHSTGDGRLRKVIITPVRKDGGRRHQGRRYNRRG